VRAPRRSHAIKTTFRMGYTTSAIIEWRLTCKGATETINNLTWYTLIMEKAVSVFELTPKAKRCSLKPSRRTVTRVTILGLKCLRVEAAPVVVVGMSYSMSLAEKPLEDDVVEEVDGLRFATPKTTLDLVRGSKIDYYEGLEGSGFIILNPKPGL